MEKTLFTLAMFFLLTLVSCGGGGSSSSSSSNSNSDTNTLFNAVKATTPTFTATVSAGGPGFKAHVSSAPTITDQAMNVAFQLLRNYTHPDDEGKVDMSNIYKVLWEASHYLAEAPSRCSSVASVTDTAIAPYQFSDFLGHTYDCTGNQAESGGYGSSVAYKVSGDNKYMLASYKWAPDSTQQIAIGVIQTSYNDTTKDISLIFAQAVNYPAGSTMGGPSGSGFSTRARITGNSGTHAFELKMLTQSASLVGKGISQGAGNFFLMRSGSNYYCLPAGATETDLAAITPTTYANVSANCASYKADVSAATPYDAGTDLPPIDLSDFNDGVTGTPVHYQMF
jgi:hypothetical protein